MSMHQMEYLIGLWRHEHGVAVARSVGFWSRCFHVRLQHVPRATGTCKLDKLCMCNRMLSCKINKFVGNRCGIDNPWDCVCALHATVRDTLDMYMGLRLRAPCMHPLDASRIKSFAVSPWPLTWLWSIQTTHKIVCTWNNNNTTRFARDRRAVACCYQPNRLWSDTYAHTRAWRIECGYNTMLCTHKCQIHMLL